MSGVRVLLVEDNELNSEIAVALLESLGAAAETAANGQEALDALDASEPGHFDVVLMDIQMPVMNGLEATRRIRESERDDLRALPVVVLSANAFTEDVQESKRAGADDHLSKPISVKDWRRRWVESSGAPDPCGASRPSRPLAALFLTAPRHHAPTAQRGVEGSCGPSLC